MTPATTRGLLSDFKMTLNVRLDRPGLLLDAKSHPCADPDARAESCELYATLVLTGYANWYAKRYI